jgi:hypothetical protein
MNELELKRKRIETVVKIGAMGVIGFLVAPFVFIAIKGLIGALIAIVISLIAINLAPWAGTKLANWRLKALKYEASQNPIETLENQYKDRENALVQIRENIKEFHAVVQALFDVIQEHNQNYPDRPSPFQEKYEKLRALLELRKQKYKQAQQNLKSFAGLIDEKRSDWKVAQAAAKASKLANVGEDFQSKLMADTALGSIQDSLNIAFSELEVSLLDEQSNPEVVVTTSPVTKAPIQITEKSGPPTLDLDFDEVQSGFVSVKS